MKAMSKISSAFNEEDFHWSNCVKFHIYIKSFFVLFFVLGKTFKKKRQSRSMKEK
jgi:hypothetical protein